MINVGLRFREMLTGTFQVVQDELDQVIAGVQGTWGIEHNPEGTHAAITSDTVQTDTIDLTGGQIKFPVAQRPSSNSNTLDDYEEGTWTPVIGGAGGTSGQTYASQSATYTKVGRLVTVDAIVGLSNKGTITGAVQIQGLPFAAAGYGAVVIVYQNLATNWVDVVGLSSPGSTALDISGAAAAAATNRTALATADIGNTTYFFISFSYNCQ